MRTLAMMLLRTVVILIGIFGFCVFTAHAASPNVTSIFPAGSQRGTRCDVTMTGSFDKWPVQCWVSGRGVSVQAGKDKGKFSVEIAADAVPGLYWLRAVNADGASSPRPFLVSVLPELLEKEPNDEPRSAQIISASSIVNGRLDKAGDVDCFRMTLKKGQTLVASVEANSTLKSPMDSILQIVSADGFILDQNHDVHGLDPQLTFTAPGDGSYILRLFAFPAVPDSSIRFSGAETYIYRLTLTTAGFAEYSSPLAVERAKPEAIRLVGWNIPQRFGTLVEPIATDEFATVFDAEVATTARVRLEAHPCYDTTISATAVRNLNPPCSVTSRLDAGERWFPIQGRKGQSLTLQVQSRTLGLAVNPVIRVTDAERKLIARAEPSAVGSDTTLTFNPPMDGVYQIGVSDLFGGTGLRHAFLLRMLTPEPDYELTVPVERIVIPPGKSTDIAVKITRRNGFARPLTFVAEGMPPGVRMETKPAVGKADPNTATLSFSGDMAGASGAFRIVGRVMDEPTLTRVARAPIPEFETTTADLWVAVSDAPVTTTPPKKKK